jgi:hypothetical protein
VDDGDRIVGRTMSARAATYLNVETGFESSPFGERHARPAPRRKGDEREIGVMWQARRRATGE